jgi:protoheme IX farnesyltransferase
MLNASPSLPITPAFRRLLLATAVALYLLIVAGIAVRVSATGGACLDWPACLGGWAPPLDRAAWAPYAHRLAGLGSGALLLVATAWAWLRYRRLSHRRLRHRRLRWLTWSLTLALFLGGGQALLGAGLVGAGNPALSALHLGVALLMLAVVVGAAVGAEVTAQAQAGDPIGAGDARRSASLSPFARFSILTLVAVFALFVSGALVAATGARAACPGWPLCDGFSWPLSALAWLSLGHRLLTLLAGGLLAGLVWRAWRGQRSQPALLTATTAAGVLFGAQALMGALEANGGYPPHLLGLHVATAVAVWAALVAQASLALLARRTAEQERLEAALSARRRGLPGAFLALTKPVVVLLLLVTTYAGMVIGGRAFPPAGLTFWVLLAGFLAAGGSGAINQFIDRDDDRKMQRTQKRPIPAGILAPGEGLAFGVALALASFYLMAAFANFLAALLTLAGIIYYVVLYSLILKKTTVQNIVIGGGAGAIPPLVGWAAVTGSLNIPAMFLFAVVFLWTPPHFWALALVRRRDYARAGVPMLPVLRGQAETRRQIFIYTIELVGLTLLLPLFGLGGSLYFVLAVALGAWLVSAAWRVWRGAGNKVAWQMYRYSSMYLAFLFLALMVDALV